jgi:hypothetical protein
MSIQKNIAGHWTSMWEMHIQLYILQEFDPFYLAISKTTRLMQKVY